MVPRRKLNKTILLLDDEASERTTAQAILQSQDYTILAADCYHDALAVFEKHGEAVDLLIADISLPDGNGCELAIAMRETKPDLRVLFVSGHVGAEVCRSSRRYGSAFPQKTVQGRATRQECSVSAAISENPDSVMRRF